MKTHQNPRSGGFTLVELLVVILIIAVLASLGFMGSRRFIESGRKVQALTQFRDFETGMKMFEVDYTQPPIPITKRSEREYIDTVYGDPDGQYSTQYLVSVLAGEDKEYPSKRTDETFSAKQSNPRGEAYMTFPFSADNRNGVGKDGVLYDPWGREVMVAINSLNAPKATLVDENTGSKKGTNDRILNTWGLGEYSDTKPRYQMYVFWSYGKDGIKGRGGKAAYAGSDDVVSWK